MKAHFASVVCFLALALALPLLGPGDGQFALYAVGGGGEVDCTTSDHESLECEGIKDEDDEACVDTLIASTIVQTCKDETYTTKTLCRKSGCINQENQKWYEGSCTKKGCGS
jgi:hypothetical protein